jgi:uncharacterized membrane protein
MNNDSTTCSPNGTLKDPLLLRSELLIATLLRWGVLLSFVIVAIGLTALVSSGQTGYDQMDTSDLSGLLRYQAESQAFPTSVEATLSGVSTFKPYAIISLGLLLLLIIPVARVAVSIVAFALERDWLYVLITTFVFATLMVSFALGRAGE